MVQEMPDPVVTITAQEAQAMRENCNHLIDLQDSLIRLKNNADFKKVFMNEYVQKEAVRLVGLLGDTVINQAPNKEALREDFHERMIGIARFSEFMRQINALGNKAREQLEQINKAIVVD